MTDRLAADPWKHNDGSPRCGPTREQSNRALSRGETMGTWPRCDECAEYERELFKRIPIQKRMEK